MGIYTGRLSLSDEAVERLWELGGNEKMEALELAYRLAFKEVGVSEAEFVPSEESKTVL